MHLGPLNFNQGVQFTPAPLRQRALPQLEEIAPQLPGDRAIIGLVPASPVPEQAQPAQAELVVPAPPLKTSAPPVPTSLSLDMGEIGAGLLSSGPAVAGPTYSSSGQIANNTVGWSGQPSPQAPLHQSHLPQIHGGIQFMEAIMPGMRSKMDQLLHTPDPVLQGKMDAIVSEQNGLCSTHAKLLNTPDERLQPHQLKQKQEVNARIQTLYNQYETAQKALDDKAASNRKQAEQLAGVFLNKLRKQGRTNDVRDRVKLEPSAQAQLQKDGISQDQVGKWVNEFIIKPGCPSLASSSSFFSRTVLTTTVRPMPSTSVRSFPSV
ncbi:hypothetical protein JST97_17160 [bacterium]|nr:hypothetical protein [bacterium]